jgi:hypothetical protein
MQHKSTKATGRQRDAVKVGESSSTPAKMQHKSAKAAQFSSQRKRFKSVKAFPANCGFFKAAHAD